MCGITGIIRFKDTIAPGAIQQMNNAIRHRGPDDEGYIAIDAAHTIISYTGADTVAAIKQQYASISSAAAASLFLGFRRLSIIDLSHCGHQPMVTEDGNVAITFNGEIYNYKELKHELIKAGYAFTSETDTEVILHGYRHWGIDVLQRLNGMFAFAVYDKQKHTVLIARDRLGIKPLFYHATDIGLVWASEMKAILKSGLVNASVYWQGLFANYQLQTTPSPYTCFENIQSLQPAHYMVVDMQKATTRIERYWSIPVNQIPIDITPSEAVAFLDSKLQSIVTMQLRSDVPVTSLMSGGVDSTTITTICARQHSDFHCYSLGFDGTGQGMDELPQAIAMAKMLGIHQHVHLIKPEDIIDTLDSDLRHFEEPYVNLEPAIASSAYLHREGYKVVMNGLGADEVFGGYNHYLDYKKWEQRKKLFFLQALVPGVNDYLRKVKNYFDLDTVFKYFINARMGMRPFEIKQLTDKPFLRADALLPDADIRTRNTPESLYYYDLAYYIGAHHVYRDDMSAMRYSLEVRYPYLDHELIEWVANLPMHIRFDGVTTKPLLRKVAERYITKENMNMPKKGFNLPLNEWMQNADVIQQYARMQLDRLKQRGIFDNVTIEKWWQRRNEGVYFSKLWQLVTTEVWLNEYVSA